MFNFFLTHLQTGSMPNFVQNVLSYITFRLSWYLDLCIIFNNMRNGVISIFAISVQTRMMYTFLFLAQIRPMSTIFNIYVNILTPV